jgi:hypothetical protein
MTELPQPIEASYYGETILIEGNPPGVTFSIGTVRLTSIGKELAPICVSRAVPGFMDFVVNMWVVKRMVLSSPFPRRAGTGNP